MTFGFGFGPTGGGGGAPLNRSVQVPATATGRLLTLSRLFGATSTFALVSGTDSNLQLDSGDGIRALAAIGAGNAQVAWTEETALDGRKVRLSVTCVGTPVAPAAPAVTLTAGDGQISVAWVDGPNGGSPITAHPIYLNGNLVATPTAASPYVISGLTNDQDYSVEVSAINGVKEGARSAAQTARPSAAPVTGLITDVQLMANLTDVSSITAAPVTVGDVLPLYTMGWVLKVALSATATIDWTKVIVNVDRPGWDNKVATTRRDLAIGNGLLRRATPNDNSPLDAGSNAFYITLDDRIFGVDTVYSITFLPGFYPGSPKITFPGSSVVRKDLVGPGLAYPQPIVRIVSRPFQVTDGATPNVAVDVTGASNFARNFREFDTVEAWCRIGGVDGPAVSTQTMGLSRHTPDLKANPSARLPGKPVPAYVLDPSSASLADGAGGVRIRVYPFCGPVWESWVSGTSYPTANVEAELPFFRDYAGKYSKVYAWPNQDGTAGTYFDGSTITNVLTVSNWAGAPITAGMVVYCGTAKRTIGTIGAGGTSGTGGNGTYQTIESGTVNASRWSTGTVQTSTADPGAAASFATAACAAQAILQYNAARTGGLAHSDTDGGVIMLRDVPGSTLGANAGAYALVPANTTNAGNFSGGLAVPLEIRAAAGSTSQLCRLRGVKQDGTSIALGLKQITGRLLCRNLTFDSTGITAASDNIIIDSGGTGQGATKAATTSHLHLIDCDVLEYASGTTAFPALYRFGWRCDYRVNQSPFLSVNNAGYTGNYQTFTKMVGGSYVAPAATGTLLPFVAGCVFQNFGLAAQGGPQFPITLADGGEIVDGYLYINCRFDNLNGAGVINLDTNYPLAVGYGLVNVFVRQAGAPNVTGIRIGGDGSTGQFANAVLHFVGSDGGFGTGTASSASNARWNVGYNDQTYNPVIKYMQKLGCTIPSLNNKSDTFLAGESMEVPYTFAAGTRYYLNDRVSDGNATVTSRIYYLYIGVSNRVATAGDLSDTSLWKSVGLLSGKTFGRNPARTGNWPIRYAVGDYGNVVANSADGNLPQPPQPLPTAGFISEKLGRNSALATDYSTWYKTPVGGAGYTLAQKGDYRPQSKASGDANDSPLLNRIEAGRGVVPFDLDGNTRFDASTGGGAAGAYERAA